MNRSNNELVVITTHPVQYHAPVYRTLREKHGVPVRIIYASDFSVAGYHDKEFGASFAWDVDLGVDENCLFLSRVKDGGAASFEDIRPDGMAAALAKTSPAAVLLTGVQPAYHLHAFRHARALGKPLLFRAETTDHARTRAAWKEMARGLFLRFLYSQCRFVLPIGRRSKDHYTAHGVASDRMIAAPYCVNTAPFQCSSADRERLRGPARARIGAAPQDDVYLFSGKLTERKGVDLLLEAVRRLPCEQRERSVLLFLGEGQMRSQLEAAARLQPEVRCWFAGFQNQTQMSEWYHAADALVLPSVWSETWGLVVNEALHHGLPALVSEGVGCAPDLVTSGITGELCEKSSVASITAALQRIAPWMKGAHVAAACRERVSAYTVDKAAAGLAEAWQRCGGRA
jgi:glycosyltransferase involved in cell wall biosynthesis